MTSAPVKYPHYFADFQSLIQGSGADAPPWLKDFREGAWNRFSQTGFPTARRGNERWKYTNVRPIAKVDFAAANRPSSPNDSRAMLPAYNLDSHTVFYLVFVDGFYSEALS